MPEIIPAEHDARQAALNGELAQAEASLWALRDKMHAAVGDKKEWHGKRRAWQMSWGEVGLALSAMAQGEDADDFRNGGRPSELLARDSEIIERMARLNEQIDAMQATWRAHRWTRYFPCLNSDGHVHSSLRGCESVSADTAMGWATELSGMSVEAAIAKLGPRLCSKCFPDAPSEWCRSLVDITRAEREAAKARKAAERAARDAAKVLPRGDWFTSERDGERITKVAELKGLIRQAVEDQVELEWLQGSKGASKADWDPEHLAHRQASQEEHAFAAQRDADRAERILVAREAGHPGWGATAAEISKMRANKERSARKDYGI